ncbi:MAG: hypothetical protein EXR75_07770 [Myxococcales bacterium]|nr:hypothetical protein [Myxococcales bacterium]
MRGTSLQSFLAVAAVVSCGCGGGDGAATQQESDVKVDTSSALAWAQYKANVEFARSYQPACSTSGSLPRVLVTGFGRFLSNRRNATGLLVSELSPGLVYPMTEPPAVGAVDPPAPQLAVSLGTVALPTMGEVELCAMVLPVFWDLAAALVLAEIESFAPDLVLMNGIAGGRQPLWLELGAVNRAAGLEDGSGVLVAIEGPVIASAPSEEYDRPNLLSWSPVKAAMLAGIQAHGAVAAAGVRFDDVLEGALFASYPRASNTYLCNNTTYAVGYVMDRPGETVMLLTPSTPREGEEGLSVSSGVDRSAVPRVFFHWPSELDGEHLGAAAQVLASGIDAQLAALFGFTDDPLPTRGDTVMADF